MAEPDAVWDDVELCGSDEACIRWDAHLHHLANTNRPCVVVMWPACQITSTTCYLFAVTIQPNMHSMKCSLWI